MNDLKSQAPTLLGSTILKPPPCGDVEFAGGWQLGAVDYFEDMCHISHQDLCLCFHQGGLYLSRIPCLLTGLE